MDPTRSKIFFFSFAFHCLGELMLCNFYSTKLKFIYAPHPPSPHPKSHNWFSRPGDLTKVVPFCLPDRCHFLTCFDRITYSLRANGREREGGPLLVWDSPVAIIIILHSCNNTFAFPTIPHFFFLDALPCPAQACMCMFMFMFMLEKEKKKEIDLSNLAI